MRIMSAAGCRGRGGKAGVTRCLDILRNELDITMALCGRRDSRGIDTEILDRAPGL